jgi:hypothetical protein
MGVLREGAARPGLWFSLHFQYGQSLSQLQGRGKHSRGNEAARPGEGFPAGPAADGVQGRMRFRRPGGCGT